MMQRFLLTNLFVKRSKYSSRIADTWFVTVRKFIRVIMFIRFKKLYFFIYESFDQFAWSKSCLFEFYNLWRVGTRQLFNSSSEFVKWNHFIQRLNLKYRSKNFQCAFFLFFPPNWRLSWGKGHFFSNFGLKIVFYAFRTQFKKDSNKNWLLLSERFCPSDNKNQFLFKSF